MGEAAATSAKVILEYIRTLIWPVIVILALLIFASDVSKILREGEISVGNVKIIGQRINQISENAQTELDEIRAELAALQEQGDTASTVKTEAEDLERRVEQLGDNIGREFQQIQRALQPATRETASRNGDEDPAATIAAEHEDRGFHCLIERDIRGALEAFGAAKKTCPEYHNVAEIHRLLSSRQRSLAGAGEDQQKEVWSDIYRTILKDYSWGMSKEYRTQFRDYLAES